MQKSHGSMAAADEPASRSRLLLVEDDDQLSSMLMRLLTDEGYAVTRAEDGQTALDRGLADPFDLVILDRSLPALDGLTVLRAWRASGVATPTLVLSARGTALDRTQGFAAGAEDYLAKPFDIGELLARLRVLRSRNRDAAC